MTVEEWNPDKACKEMAELFEQADQIFNQPHYQEASADELEPPSADPSPTTDKPIVRTK